MNGLRRFRPSGSMLVALLALVLATTGSAVAASTLITSKQIKNHTIQTVDISKKAIKSLRGKRGATGPAGPTGAAGPVGAPGAKGDKGDTGPAGPFPDALPSGKTVRGAFAVQNPDGNTGETAISYVWPVSSRPNVIEVPSGGPTPTGCSGDVDHPGAAAGNLCIFVGWTTNEASSVPDYYDPDDGTNDRAGFTGVILYNSGSSASYFEQNGSWALTAP